MKTRTIRILSLAAVGLAAAPPALAGDLRVGAAAVVITPPTGVGMAGYYHARGATGVHDDLHAKAIVIEKDGARAALVALDLIGTTRPLVEAARREIERRTRIPGAHVMISATHAHTGPVLSERSARPDARATPRETAEYAARLPGLIADAAARAAERLAPAAVSVAVGRADGLAFNRRFHMRDGSVGWNPGKLNPAIVRPAGPVDPDVPVVVFEGSDRKPLATYVNYALHLDTVGGTEISADYPHALAKILGAVRGPEMLTVFTIGTAGDINHIDVSSRTPQKGHGEAARIGGVLAAAVLRAHERLEPIAPDAVRVAATAVKLPLAPVTPQEVAAARTTADRQRADPAARIPFLEQVRTAKALDVAARGGRPLDPEVQVIALGDDLAFVSLPGEIFVELGMAIKQASPFRHTIIAELANGSIGYVPNRVAYPQGNYEVVSARCAAGSGERLVDAALDLLRRLHGQAVAARQPLSTRAAP